MLTMNRRGVAGIAAERQTTRTAVRRTSSPRRVLHVAAEDSVGAMRSVAVMPSRLYVPGPDPAHVGRVPIVVTCARVVCLCLTPPSSRRPPT